MLQGLGRGLVQRLRPSPFLYVTIFAITLAFEPALDREMM